MLLLLVAFLLFSAFKPVSKQADGSHCNIPLPLDTNWCWVLNAS